MNRRTLIAAAPAVALVGAVPAAAATGPTSPIWQEFEQALATYNVAKETERALEQRDGLGNLSDEFREAESLACDLWSASFDLGRRAYATPVRSAADVLGKARAIAICGLEIDDWEAEDAALVEALLRDLATVYGVSRDVAAIIDPFIATRDALKAKRAAIAAADAALKPQPAAYVDPDAALHQMIADYHVMADLNCEADPHSAEIRQQHALIERIAETSPSTTPGALAKLRLGFDDDQLQGLDECGPLDRVSAASVRDVLRLLDGRAA